MNTDVSAIITKKHSNNFRRQAIRDIYYNLLTSGISPTVSNLSPKINEVLNLQIQPSALIEIYKSLGFIYIHETSQLIETNESRLKRINYIKTIQKTRSDATQVAYVLISETTIAKIHIIVMIAALEQCILKDTIVVMNASKFAAAKARAWLRTKVIRHISYEAVLVMNNTTYDKLVSDVPGERSSHKIMETWLESFHIPYDEDLLKPELYEIIKLHKANFINRELSVKSIIIPDDHPGFNPLDIVWYNMEPYDSENLARLEDAVNTKPITVLGMLKKQKANLILVDTLAKAIDSLFNCMLEKTWQSCINKVTLYERKILKLEEVADSYEDKAWEKGESVALIENEPQPLDKQPVLSAEGPVNSSISKIEHSLKEFNCDDDSE